MIPVFNVKQASYLFRSGRIIVTGSHEDKIQFNSALLMRDLYAASCGQGFVHNVIEQILLYHGLARKPTDS